MKLRIPAGLIFLALVAAGTGPARAEWTFLPPDPPAGGEASLSFVDATSYNDVWAVGAYRPAGLRCLAEHFDGASWTQFPLPDDPANEGTLRGISTASPGRAIAVGTHTPVGTTAQPLAMELNGSEWTLIPAPELQGGRVFSAVDHSSEGTVWVAGYEYGRAFLARRSGDGWNLEFAPPVGIYRNRFYAVHARSDSEIWVVGTQSDRLGQFRILLQRFDGGAGWTTFNVSSPSGIDDSMTGVIAFAPNDAWAVGYYYHIPLYHYQPLILHFDGAGWTAVDLPDFPEGSVRLEAVMASGRNDIYSAGTYSTADGTPRPFMLHFDGTGWTEVTLPPTGGRAEWFRGIAAIPGGGAWAVGQYFDGTITEPMAFRLGEPASTSGGPDPGRPQVGLWSAPNPFRSSASIHFTLDQPGVVRLRVMDASGRLVRMIFEGELGVGQHAIPWDGLDAAGRRVPAGVYFDDLEAKGLSEQVKVIRIQ